MKRTINWDLIETRDSIRQSAYDLARGGLCDGWQEVWRALRSRFSLHQLTVIFENPLCRLDIDQRCYQARNPGKVARDVQGDLDAINGRAAIEGRPSAIRVAVVTSHNSQPSDLAILTRLPAPNEL
jgi:hypothetical protein